MPDSIAPEFSTFLYLLIGADNCRYFDDAKKLMSLVKAASEPGIEKSARQSRVDVLSDFCRNLIRRLEADRGGEYRYRIPLAVREIQLSTLDLASKLSILGNFELAVRRFERPDADVGRWPDSSDAA